MGYVLKTLRLGSFWTPSHLTTVWNYNRQNNKSWHDINNQTLDPDHSDLTPSSPHQGWTLHDKRFRFAPPCILWKVVARCWSLKFALHKTLSLKGYTDWWGLWHYTPMVGFMPLVLLAQNVKPTVYGHVQGTWLTPHENITINIVASICINHELSWLYIPLSSIIPFICRLWFNHHWQLPSGCRGGIPEKSLTSAFATGGVATGRACDGILANAEGLAMEVCCPQVI